MIPKKIKSQHTFALLFTKQNSDMKKVASKSKGSFGWGEKQGESLFSRESSFIKGGK